MLPAYVRVARTAFEIHLKQTAVDLFVVFTVFVQPLMIALLGLFMLADRGPDYGIFVIVGSGMTGIWSSTLFFSSWNIRGERWTGTLEMLIGAPTPLQVVVAGKSLANVVVSLGSMAGSYVVAAGLLGVPIRIERPVEFVVSSIFTIVAMVGLSLLLSPLMVVNPAFGEFVNALEFPVYVLGGFLFPVLLLPGWTTPLSYVLAPYWAARALHLTSSGPYDQAALVLSWGAMLVLAVAYALIAGPLFRAVLRKARESATLGMY